MRRKSIKFCELGGKRWATHAGKADNIGSRLCERSKTYWLAEKI